MWKTCISMIMILLIYIYNAYEKLAYCRLYRLNSYLFKENTLYVIDSSIRELLVCEGSFKNFILKKILITCHP